jgi:hypothetical protein
MFARILKPILQNSKLNRVKFVKNKKLYIDSIVKNRQQNHNKVVTRKMATFSEPGSSFYGGGGGGGGPNWSKGIIYMFIVAVSCNISSKLIKSAKSKE